MTLRRVDLGLVTLDLAFFGGERQFRHFRDTDLTSIGIVTFDVYEMVPHGA